jgi:Flp pilus assembly pilin Flp
MRKITSLVKAFIVDEKGAETVEWVMIAAVLAGIISAAYWTTLKGGVDSAIGNINNKMSNPTG